MHRAAGDMCDWRCRQCQRVEPPLRQCSRGCDGLFVSTIMKSHMFHTKKIKYLVTLKGQGRNAVRVAIFAHTSVFKTCLYSVISFSSTKCFVISLQECVIKKFVMKLNI